MRKPARTNISKISRLGDASEDWVKTDVARFEAISTEYGNLLNQITQPPVLFGQIGLEQDIYIFKEEEERFELSINEAFVKNWGLVFFEFPRGPIEIRETNAATGTTSSQRSPTSATLARDSSLVRVMRSRSSRTRAPTCTSPLRTTMRQLSSLSTRPASRIPLRNTTPGGTICAKRSNARMDLPAVLKMQSFTKVQKQLRTYLDTVEFEINDIVACLYVGTRIPAVTSIRKAIRPLNVFEDWVAKEVRSFEAMRQNYRALANTMRQPPVQTGQEEEEKLRDANTRQHIFLEEKSIDNWGVEFFQAGPIVIRETMRNGWDYFTKMIGYFCDDGVRLVIGRKQSKKVVPIKNQNMHIASA